VVKKLIILLAGATIISGSLFASQGGVVFEKQKKSVADAQKKVVMLLQDNIKCIEASQNKADLKTCMVYFSERMSELTEEKMREHK
jgi:hypothetical protein